MDVNERLQLINAVRDAAMLQPALPWWAMDALRILEDVVHDLDDIAGLCDQLEVTAVEQQKTLNGLRDKYSEVLYKLKSGD